MATMEQLKTFFSGEAIGKVLDIGTGSGDFIRLIQPVFGENTRITGIDPSDEALTEESTPHRPLQSVVTYLLPFGFPVREPHNIIPTHHADVAWLRDSAPRAGL